MSNKSGARVCVYGATGTMGRRVAQTLASDGQAIRVAGRRAPELKALATRLDVPWSVASADSATALSQALRDCDMVIDCHGGVRGPTRDVMAQTALRAGVHFLDLSREVSSVRRIVEVASREQRSGVVAMPGFGVSALVSWGVQMAQGQLKTAEPHHVEVTFAYSRPVYSPGVAGTALRVGAGPAYHVQGGRLSRLPQRRTAVVELPKPFGRRRVLSISGAELATLAQEFPAVGASSYISFGHRPIGLLGVGPSQSAESFELAISVRVRSGDRCCQVVTSLRDPYLTSAHLVAASVDLVRLRAHEGRWGWLTPTALCGFETMYRSLRERRGRAFRVQYRWRGRDTP